MTDKGYLLDTGVFVQAHRRWYTQDIVPGFWDALLHFQGAGRSVSLDRCRAEIYEGDALAAWVAGAPGELFLSTADVEIANKYAEVMGWAAGADFSDAAKAEFASGADGWLVAYGGGARPYCRHARDARTRTEEQGQDPERLRAVRRRVAGHVRDASPA